MDATLSGVQRKGAVEPNQRAANKSIAGRVFGAVGQGVRNFLSPTPENVWHSRVAYTSARDSKEVAALHKLAA